MAEITDPIVSNATGDVGEFWVDLHRLKKLMHGLQGGLHRLIKDKEGNTTVHARAA